jgi:hypothetical protein
LQTTTFNAGHLLVDLVRAAPYCHYGTKKELFNFDKDVKSISINRWAHAYAHGNPGAVGLNCTPSIGQVEARNKALFSVL